MEQELGVLLDPIGSDAKRCKVLRTARAGGDPVLLASHAAIFDIPSYVVIVLHSVVTHEQLPNAILFILGGVDRFVRRSVWLY